MVVFLRGLSPDSLKKQSMAFNLIYLTLICNEYFQRFSVLEKCGKSMEKNSSFSRRLWLGSFVFERAFPSLVFGRPLSAKNSFRGVLF